MEVANPKSDMEMTHQNDHTFTSELEEKGLEAFSELLRVLINNIMQTEKSKALKAGENERTQDRKGQANGFKPMTVKTRMGEITFSVPQEREGGFYASALKKGLRSERALVTTLAEMYIQGGSNKKLKPSPKHCAELRSKQYRSTRQPHNWKPCCRSAEKDC